MADVRQRLAAGEQGVQAAAEDGVERGVGAGQRAPGEGGASAGRGESGEARTGLPRAAGAARRGEEGATQDGGVAEDTAAVQQARVITYAAV